ncbi:ABC transporter substrate-binding protein [Ancylobacter sp. MQZ15Z-1]|uniref:ABC transporter substrate-binding protein n=1 Tax=Ancylobacter mangrovi TaxID=2972472 RepID=A0A9X2T1I8_9HYPH|nr:ABC transporter substrate-binding protein [Ancylobacter mangrovi]MCS0494737.1 ABC transporter substrate-binding protein [Ancylobacter mangrovi]
MRALRLTYRRLTYRRLTYRRLTYRRLTYRRLTYRRLALAALTVAGLTGLQAPVRADDAPQHITLFGQPSVNNDSVWMAFEKGFFKDQGLDITYRLFPSGTTALQSFQAGQGDIVMAGDLPSVQYFFKSGKKFRVIAAMERDSKGYVIAAGKDIKTPQDLIGKTVATRVGSTGSWFISEYLTKNGIDPSKVTIKNLDTQLLPTALCQGDIAAFFIWQPIGSRALEICPDKVHYLGDASGYIRGYLLAGAREDWLNTEEGAKAATHFLEAVTKGQAVAEKDFPAVAAYAKAKLDLSEKATRDQYDTMERPIALDDGFFKDFCSLNKWALGAKVTDEPLDLSKFIWVKGLEAVDPKRVSTLPSSC